MMANINNIENMVRASKDAKFNDELLNKIITEKQIKDRLQWEMQKNYELMNIFDDILDRINKQNDCSCEDIYNILKYTYLRYKMEIIDEEQK